MLKTLTIISWLILGWFTPAQRPITVCKTFIQSTFPVGLEADKNYTLPLITPAQKGQLILSWTERDAAGNSAFCMAISEDNGQTYSPKRQIINSAAFSNSRMMRAKVLSRPNGDLVAVFTMRADVAAAPVATSHDNHTTPTPARPAGGRGGRSATLVYVVSKDQGQSWTEPKAVDTDPKQGIMRGFFDATVMANGEIAVAYLKDVANSTKHEERDLRLAITKNGVFQDEKLIDPVVCDCCPISLLVDKNGYLNVYYRDNNNDVRDIAQLVSKDHGQSFGKSEIIHADKWEIRGCPHSGASSVATNTGNWVTWYSGTQNTPAGIRLTAGDTKLVGVLEPEAKNAALATDGKNVVWGWEQKGQIKYRMNKNEETKTVEGVNNGQNLSIHLVNGKTLLAYEVVNTSKGTSLEYKILD